MVVTIFQKLNRYFERRKNYGAFFLRILIGWRLIDGTQDNVFSWHRMLEFRDFLAQHHVAYPLLAAIVSVYAQFICGILYMTGVLIRPAAIIMIVNFTVAIFLVHLGTTFQQSFEVLTMFTVSVFFLFLGAGKLSLPDLIGRNRSKA